MAHTVQRPALGMPGFLLCFWLHKTLCNNFCRFACQLTLPGDYGLILQFSEAHCSPLLYPLGNKPALLSSSILTAVLSYHLHLRALFHVEFHEVSSQYLCALIRSAKIHFHKSEDFNIPTEKMSSPVITLFYAERFQTSKRRLFC